MVGKSNNVLYLIIGISFLIIFLISIYNGIDPKIVVIYSSSTLVFSISDVFNAFYNGRNRYKEICNPQDLKLLDDCINLLKMESQKTISVVKESADQLEFAKNKILEMLENNKAPSIDEQSTMIFSTTDSILSEKERQYSDSVQIFDIIDNFLDTLSLQKTNSIGSILQYIFLSISVILILVSPFIPLELVITIFGDQYNDMGIYFTILTLTLIFFSIFIRNHFENKIKDYQAETFNLMKHFSLEFRGLSMLYASEISKHGNKITTNLDEALKLSSIPVKRSKNIKQTKGNQREGAH